MALKAMNSYAQRTESLRPEGAYHVSARSQALEADGRQIIHFEIGQPDVDTFENICQAGIRAISEGYTRYTPPASIVVDGFSKTYSMTGWRLGYGIMPVELGKRIDLLLTHSVGRTAHFTQLAGLEAITGPQDSVLAMVHEYEARRDLIVDGLRSIPGITCRRPQGAFYVFPNIKSSA